MPNLVILDLDGTLTPQRPSSVAPFEKVLLPGVRKKCKELRQAGATLAIATNQGGLRKGLAHGELWDMLDWVQLALDIQSVKYAVHPGPRKKPEPGMLLELMREFDTPPSATLFVGDSEGDREAARRAGCKFAWAKDFFK